MIRTMAERDLAGSLLVAGRRARGAPRVGHRGGSACLAAAPASRRAAARPGPASCADWRTDGDGTSSPACSSAPASICAAVGRAAPATNPDLALAHRLARVVPHQDRAADETSKISHGRRRGPADRDGTRPGRGDDDRLRRIIATTASVWGLTHRTARGGPARPAGRRIGCPWGQWRWRI